jgi:hypothetical protein
VKMRGVAVFYTRLGGEGLDSERSGYERESGGGLNGC